ncbi:Hypothetical protein ORPV_200 [Orpheovirus IHUMI-LCC2]|uniref:Uncharacterized protein n=1 Tax=Orpheovirus IHUMI-LCC2 TaxID=2023057 RepID=A0A2I2L3I9_9VIRU|nr:Hypothetical protein ORPV_200 [Orpheovirus IHUMI-LCC2]SNW62104.1 Hypothetical protein ORPV_200 [Orpheovirus IHUMI-LCC2]
MGVDGRLQLADGIFINLYYIPDDAFKFIDTLMNKYSNMFEYNRMDDPGKNMIVILFLRNDVSPQYIYPIENYYSRRPLIINNKEQLKLLKPKDILPNTEQEDNKLWNPSYEDFQMILNKYELDGDFNKIQEIIDNITNRRYEDENGETVSLQEQEKGTISNLLYNLIDIEYAIAGKILSYIAD